MSRRKTGGYKRAISGPLSGAFEGRDEVARFGSGDEENGLLSMRQREDSRHSLVDSLHEDDHESVETGRVNLQVNLGSGG